MSPVEDILRASLGGRVWPTVTLCSEMCVAYKQVIQIEIQSEVSVYKLLHKMKGCFSRICLQCSYSMECGIP